MSLNSQPSSVRTHIGFFGLRNAGKSSLVNAVTAQQVSIVSPEKGTTTDPVIKTMEILPLGPVVIIDTPGIDDEGTLGELRVKRARQILSKTDIAVLVTVAGAGLTPIEEELIELFKERRIPYIIAYNKADLTKERTAREANEIYVSALTKENLTELKELIGRLNKEENPRQLLGDLIRPEDVIILVTPIDESAPKGRMILPQQQMIREVLDYHALNIVVQVPQLKRALELTRPRMVITDSQAFGEVSRIVPEDIPLTSFSILFARYKGELEEYVKGAAKLDKLKEGDRILISEGCTHHRQCQDIGTVKIPAWLEKYTGKHFGYTFTSGGEFPEDTSEYALIIHCGACMLTEREVHSRIARAGKQETPITNYGIAIAQLHGILKRSLSPFQELSALL